MNGLPRRCRFAGWCLFWLLVLVHEAAESLAANQGCAAESETNEAENLVDQLDHGREILLENIETLMASDMTGAWKLRPKSDERHDRPLLRILRALLDTATANEENDIKIDMSNSSASVRKDDSNTKVTPDTLKLLIHQAKCPETIIPCSDCAKKYNITRKIDLTDYYLNETWHVQELYPLLHQYATETARMLQGFALNRAPEDMHYDYPSQRYGTNKQSESLFLYYQDPSDKELIQIGSEAELKLTLSRNQADVVKILACSGW